MLLSPTQTGYGKFRSTEDKHAYLAQNTEDAFPTKKVLAVFFDFSNAFDKVWKEELLVKLLRTGVRCTTYLEATDKKMEKSSLKKLALMRKLAGATWGADSSILTRVYTATVPWSMHPLRGERQPRPTRTGWTKSITWLCESYLEP